MSVFDVTTGTGAEIDEILWTPDTDFNLVKRYGGVSIDDCAADILSTGTPILQDKEEAENFIKAVQKAIDLGWFTR